MKKLILICLLALFTSPTFAQAQQEESQRTEEYVLVVATSKLLSTKVTIALDYGQEQKLFKDQRVRSEDGKVQAFNSVVDALNYMNSQGWRFVNAYAITMGNSNVYHYLMRREVEG